LDLIRILIDNGADVNLAPDKKFKMVAVQEEDIETVKLIIENGANINSRDRAGCTALIYASKSDNAEYC